MTYFVRTGCTWALSSVGSDAERFASAAGHWHTYDAPFDDPQPTSELRLPFEVQNDCGASPCISEKRLVDDKLNIAGAR